MTPTPFRFLRVAARVAATLAVVGVLATPLPASAGTYVAISGSGSSWSSVALDQWSQDLRPSGLVINYNPDGSAAGRADYMADQDDFAGSDPPFRNGLDQLGGVAAEKPNQGYSYIPDTAGGTAFMYHIEVSGHLIRNLRLSGETIMKIFTGQITNWDNKEITHDYGAQLPNLPITPVIRSDGSGATFFFTRWMAHMFPSQWDAFCKQVKQGVHFPCGQTEFYPLFKGAKSENGSNNIATYITASYGDGSIGYDEYAYALNSHYPVVKVLNPAGYYVLPTASNVAVALTKAVINEDPNSPDFLQQNLDSVYTFTDARSYPLSSYAYLIVPRVKTQRPTNFSPAKGKSLSTYIDYFLCAGQRESAALGYSPLPLNLVQGGLLQSSKIPGAIPGPNLATLAGCSNPTFTHGKLTLLIHAPYPSPCDKVGESLSCLVVNGKATAPGSGSRSPSAGASASAAGTAASTAPSAVPTSTEPVAVTGQVVNVASASPGKLMLAVLTALAIVLAVTVPPALGGWMRRRRQQEQGRAR